MAQPTFGMLPGNNAPPPPFFAGNNPTGGKTNLGGASKGMNSNFPNYPMFGTPSTGIASPTANMPIFGASDFKGLSTGLYSSLTGKPGNPGDHLYKELTNAYGKGAGAAIFDQLIKGSFSPQVAAAFMNAMQPQINRGEASLLNSFGASGSRFSSTAALGLGDYLSQAQLGEEQALASMYMQSQQQDRQFLEGLLPTLHAEEANKGGLWHDILGGLEIAGGVALEFVPGGQALGMGLMGQGVGTLAGGLDGGSGSNGMPSMPHTVQPNYGGTPPFLSPGTMSNDSSSFWDTYSRDSLTGSAGNALSASNNDNGWGDLDTFLMMGGH